MKKIFTICILAVLLIALNGCMFVTLDGLGGNNVHGTGDKVTRDFNVGNFTGLNIAGGYVIVYRQAQESSVTVHMQENLFNYLNTTVENGVLRIYSDRNFRTTSENTPRIYVYTPELNHTVVSGLARLENWDTLHTTRLLVSVGGAVTGTLPLDVENVEINIAGSGNFELTGVADTARISLAGAGNVDASGLQTRAAWADIAGAGTIEIAVSDSLDATISGTGNIWYIGSPQVSRSVAGIGRVQQR